MTMYRTRGKHGLIDKEYYRSLEMNGFAWGGFDSETGLHFFQKEIIIPQHQITDNLWRVRRTEYLMMECTDEQIENGTALWMAENGYTYKGTK